MKVGIRALEAYGQALYIQLYLRNSTVTWYGNSRNSWWAFINVISIQSVWNKEKNDNKNENNSEMRFGWFLINLSATTNCKQNHEFDLLLYFLMKFKKLPASNNTLSSRNKSKKCDLNWICLLLNKLCHLKSKISQMHSRMLLC